jgi:ABC-type polysaccharide/polyol phosphate export permease
MRLARTMAMGWAIHFKQESRNPFLLWILVCTPLIYATMAYFLFRGGTDGPTLVAAAVGTAMMGIWSLTTTAAAAALQWRRRVGLLELLVAAPVPFWAVLAPITIAISALGVYSIAASLLYTRLLFGVSLPVEDWSAFAAAVPASILAIGMLGFLLGAAFVRFRAAWAVGNLFVTHTLSLLVVSPASRLALFLGRAAPVAVNGAIVAAFAFVVGSLLLDVSVPSEALGGLVLTIGVIAFACTGLGIVNASLGLRWRESALLSNMILYFLLLAAGVNVPLDLLPGWLSTIAQGLPVTHGVEAARELVAGSPLVDVAPLLGAELLVGLVYATIGLFLVRLFELEGRRGASLELA